MPSKKKLKLKAKKITLIDLEKSRLSIADSVTANPAEVITFRRALIQVLRGAFPFLATRAIELTADYLVALMIASKDSGAASLAGSSQVVLRSIPAVFLYYLAIMVKQEKNPQNMGNLWKAGIVCALILSIPACFLGFYSSWILKNLGQPAASVDVVHDYLIGYRLGIPFTLTAVSSAMVLLGKNSSDKILLLTVSTRLPTLLVGYALMYGELGAPELGVRGLGAVNGILPSVSFLLGSLIVFAKSANFSDCNMKSFSKGAFLSAVSEMFSKGGPICIYAIVELLTLVMSVFLIGRLQNGFYLDATAPAFQNGTFMANITFAFGTPIAVMITGALKEMRLNDAIRIGTINNILSTFIPLVTMIAFVTASDYFLKPFLSEQDFANQNIRSAAYSFALITFIGQVFDGLRTALTSNLRGHGDTKASAQVNLVAMILINLPLAFLSSFVWENPFMIMIARTLAIAAGAGALKIKYLDVIKVITLPEFWKKSSDNQPGFFTRLSNNVYSYWCGKKPKGQKPVAKLKENNSLPAEFNSKSNQTTYVNKPNVLTRIFNNIYVYWYGAETDEQQSLLELNEQSSAAGQPQKYTIDNQTPVEPPRSKLDGSWKACTIM